MQWKKKWAHHKVINIRGLECIWTRKKIFLFLLWHCERERERSNNKKFICLSLSRLSKKTEKNIKLANFFTFLTLFLLLFDMPLKIARDWVHWTLCEAQFCLIENAKQGVSEWVGGLRFMKVKIRWKAFIGFLSSCSRIYCNFPQFSCGNLKEYSCKARGKRTLEHGKW